MGRLGHRLEHSFEPYLALLDLVPFAVEKRVEDISRVSWNLAVSRLFFKLVFGEFSFLFDVLGSGRCSFYWSLVVVDQVFDGAGRRLPEFVGDESGDVCLDF